MHRAALFEIARGFRLSFDGTSEIHRTVVAAGVLKGGAKTWDIGA